MSKGSIEIRTEESDGVCGVTLEVNKVYLLNGKCPLMLSIINTLNTLSISTYHYTKLDKAQIIEMRVQSFDFAFFVF